MINNAIRAFVYVFSQLFSWALKMAVAIESNFKI